MTITAASMQKDVYKEFHARAYHPDVSEVYANFTSRSGKLSNVENNEKVAFVGLQYFIKSYLQEEWDVFFKAPKQEAVANHKRILSAMLGYPVSVKYLEDLHDLGYLPLRIKALPEGTLVPYLVPPITIVNTKEGFQWLTNMIETVLSCENWPISVDATEHSVTCSWIMEGEIEFFRYLMQEQSPTGILSVVSDTWDFWTLVTEYLPQLKNEIMTRDGTLVIRPDSGDPVIILTGYLLSPHGDYQQASKGKNISIKKARVNGFEAIQWGEDIISTREGEEGRVLPECEQKGLIECLWDTFGGTTTDNGFKLLDEHIGAIYGDAITLPRQRQILQRLMNKGFASKVVLGIGSYSYQYVTRDTHGSAVKATSVVKNGERVAIFKDPKTDTKKKSAKGLIKVERIDGELTMFDNVTEEEEGTGLLETVYEDGKLIKECTLADIRAVIDQQI